MECIINPRGLVEFFGKDCQVARERVIHREAQVVPWQGVGLLLRLQMQVVVCVAVRDLKWGVVKLCAACRVLCFGTASRTVVTPAII